MSIENWKFIGQVSTLQAEGPIYISQSCLKKVHLLFRYPLDILSHPLFKRPDMRCPPTLQASPSRISLSPIKLQKFPSKHRICDEFLSTPASLSNCPNPQTFPFGVLMDRWCGYFDIVLCMYSTQSYIIYVTSPIICASPTLWLPNGLNRALFPIQSQHLPCGYS
jgi:hypothetical protein